MDNEQIDLETIKKYLQERFGIVLGVLALIILVIGFLNIQVDEYTGPCSEKSIQHTCYSVETQACLAAWENFRLQCKDLVPKMLKRPFKPTELVTPKIERCQRMLFDKTFQYMRKNDVGPECEKLFEDIKGMKSEYEEATR